MKAKSLLFIVVIVLSYFFYKPTESLAADLCCPTGSSTTQCPSNFDPTKCCIKPSADSDAFTSVNKISCDSSQAVPCSGGSCQTALGSIKTNPTDFITSVFGILLSIAGGVALILIIVSGYRLMSSQGNPEKVQQAREQLTSAIVGLLFIIFSMTILQIIGVDILNLPGFGK